MFTETTVQPPTTAAPTAAPLANFFSAAEARFDRWRQFCAVARAWQAAAVGGKSENAPFGDALSLFSEVAALEAFFAYPGSRLMAAIEQSLSERNAATIVAHGIHYRKRPRVRPISCRLISRPATATSRISRRWSSPRPTRRSGSAPGTT
jgi:hypothetical protein